MTINQNEAARIGQALASAIHEHWGLFLLKALS